MFHLEEGISVGYWTVSSAAETSAGQPQDRGDGGRCCSGPMTAVGPGFQLLRIEPQLLSVWQKTAAAAQELN